LSALRRDLALRSLERLLSGGANGRTRPRADFGLAGLGARKLTFALSNIGRPLPPKAEFRVIEFIARSRTLRLSSSGLSALSRAKESLSLVAYASKPERIKDFVLDQGWFDPYEVVTDTQIQ
jgi:hypothetical protein